MPIMKRFSLIEALMISKIFRKYCENMKFKTLILGVFQQSEFCVLFRIFVCLSETQYFDTELNKISRFKMVTKN